MGIAVTLTLTFVVAEAVCGWLGHSLALLSEDRKSTRLNSSH